MVLHSQPPLLLQRQWAVLLESCLGLSAGKLHLPTMYALEDSYSRKNIHKRTCTRMHANLHVLYCTVQIFLCATAICMF